VEKEQDEAGVLNENKNKKIYILFSFRLQNENKRVIMMSVFSFQGG
jgi:hypothetical protein